MEGISMSAEDLLFFLSPTDYMCWIVAYQERDKVYSQNHFNGSQLAKMKKRIPDMSLP